MKLLAAERAERALFDRMNPFSRSHHSDTISLHSATDAMRFPGSEKERKAFKKRVAKFYGLTSWIPGRMVDMLGNNAPTSAVTLAHIWPSSYTNWEDPQRELALPEGFYKDERNFLLLPEEVHHAFDKGHVIFVPSVADITCYVLPGADVSGGVRAYHGTQLRLPSGKVPYKRQLAYFSLRAKGRRTVDATIQRALEEALNASADSTGNAALQALEERMRAIQLL